MSSSLFTQDGHMRLAPGRSEVSLLFSGDICPLGRYADNFAAGELEGLMPDVLGLSDAADLHITNLELPLTRRGKPIQKCGPNFRASPDVVRGLRQLRVTHACLANNHIRDYGNQGISDTLSTLTSNRIVPVGIATGLNGTMAPLFFSRNGIRFCLLNVAEAEFAYPTDKTLGASFLDEPSALLTIQAAASKADVMMVVVHGGREYQYFPAYWMRALCRRFLKAGADIVIAHHAHVPQGIEVTAEGLICYSLGNFVFDYEAHKALPGTRIGYLVRCGVTRAGKLAEIDIIPTFKRDDASVAIPVAAWQNRFFRFLAEISKPLASDPESQAIWKEYVRQDIPEYLQALARHAPGVAAAAAQCADPGSDALMLYAYLVGCRSHGEISRTAIRLVFEREMKSVPRWANLIAGWEKTMGGLVSSASEK